MKAFTFIGTTDEVTDCGCCGRGGLKGTTVLKDSDGEFHFYGSVCGAKALGWTVQDFNKAGKSAQKQREQARIKARRELEFNHPMKSDIAAALKATEGKTFQEKRLDGSLDRVYTLQQQLRNDVNRQIETMFPKVVKC